MELGIGLTKYAPVVIYVISFIVILLTLFHRIEIGIIYFVFFLPLQNLLFWAKQYPLGKDINDLLLLGMIIVTIVRYRESDNVPLSKIPLKISLFLLLGWTFFGVLIGTQNIGLGSAISLHNPLFLAWKNYLIPFLLYFIVFLNIKTRRQQILVVGAMLLAVLFLDRNVYNVLRYSDLSHYSQDIKVAGIGTALSGNYLAVFLAQYTIVFVSLLLLDSHKWRRIGYGLVIAFSYYCVMFLFSRGGYFACVVSLFWIGLLKSRKLLFALVVIGVFWSVLLPTAVKERITMTKSGDEYDETTMERLLMWEIAMDLIADKPVTGSGFGFTSRMSIKLENDPRFANYTWGSFHNNYLQTLVDTGVVGLTIILWLYVLCFWLAWRQYRSSQDGFTRGLALGLMGCTLAILTANLTSTTWHFFNISGYYWVLAACVARTTDQQDTNAMSEKKPGGEQTGLRQRGTNEFLLRRVQGQRQKLYVRNKRLVTENNHVDIR